MNALKTLVIVMGIAILAGMTILVAVVVQRMTHRNAGDEPVQPVRASGAPDLALALGARIRETQLSGGRLVLRVEEGAGEKLYILDTADGHVVATVTAGARP